MKRPDSEEAQLVIDAVAKSMVFDKIAERYGLGLLCDLYDGRATVTHQTDSTVESPHEK